MRIGRQFLFAGVGRGPIDGLKLTYRGSDNGKLLLYAGTSAPLTDSEKIDRWNESHMFGGELTVYYLFGSVAKFSYMRRSKSVEPFELNPPRLGISSVNPTSLQRQAVGIDVTRELNDRMSLYLRTDLSVGDGVPDGTLALERSELIVTYNRPKSHYITAEFLNRRPLIYVNSFFSRFSRLLRRSNELSLALDKRISEEFWYNGKIAVVQYGAPSYGGESSRSLRFNTGISLNGLTAGLTVRNGYGGDWIGVYGGYYGKITKTISLRLDGEWSAFSLTSFDLLDDSDESSAFGVRTGGNWKINRHISVDAEIQTLAQSIEWANIADFIPFAGNDREFRAFAKVNFWIFKGKGY